MATGYEADPKAMSFLEHLRDLRKVLIHSVVAILVGTAVAWAFSGRLLDLLLVALNLEGVQFLSPMEPFQARFRVALIVGLAASLPYVAIRVWAFVVPALKADERRVILPSAFTTTLLFFVGAAFAIYVLTPMMLSLLMGFGTEHARADLALGPVLSFVFRMTIACALLFQLPLVLALTSFLGVTSPKLLLKWWRHAMVGIFILAAVVTPGDGPSQVILAVPLVVLYFLSVLISWVIWRGRRGEVEVSEATEPGAEDIAREPVPPRKPPAGTAPRGVDPASPSSPASDDEEEETR